MRWADLGERFDARPLRERIILTVMVAVLLILGSVQFFLDPAFKRSSMAARQASDIESRIVVLEDQLPLLEEAALRDPNQPLDAAFESLSGALADLDAQIETRMSRLVQPSEMVDSLKTLLDQQTGVTLKEVRNLVPVPVYVTQQTTSDSGEDEAEEPPTPDLYRHGLKIVLEGDFFSLLKYVLKIERHDGRFAWDTLRLNVEDYPKSTLEIELQTLSLEAGWLDV